jgi:hypothetical protein
MGKEATNTNMPCTRETTNPALHAKKERLFALFNPNEAPSIAPDAKKGTIPG